MAYIPGFSHDLFVSYAHRDDRAWLPQLVTDLRTRVQERLGAEIALWMDSLTPEELERSPGLDLSKDYRNEIPKNLDTSAILLFFPSPYYIASGSCVRQECERATNAVAAKRRRFNSDSLKNENFAFRCPILPIENATLRKLFPGCSDTFFCDRRGRFERGSKDYNESLNNLVDAVVVLLQRMRSHATPVFLYPNPPRADLAAVHEALTTELADRGYRVLPDVQVSLADQLQESALVIFLLGTEHDSRLTSLAHEASRHPERRWIVWRSPSVANGDDRALGAAKLLAGFNSRTKTYLPERTSVDNLKQIVLDALEPPAWSLPDTDGKPRVYLIYNKSDREHAGSILVSYENLVHFDRQDDEAQHTERLMKSDGVLLVWGAAREEWWGPGGLGSPAFRRPQHAGTVPLRAEREQGQETPGDQEAVPRRPGCRTVRT